MGGKNLNRKSKPYGEASNALPAGKPSGKVDGECGSDQVVRRNGSGNIEPVTVTSSVNASIPLPIKGSSVHLSTSTTDP